MRLFREFIETLILTLIIFLILRTSFQAFKVNYESMMPNVQPGQWFMVNKAVYLHVQDKGIIRLVPFLKRQGDVAYLFHPPHRGEVVILTPPIPAQNDFIKRVIGLPGETVEIRGGQVYIDGQPLSEPYIKDPPSYIMPPRQIPAGQYFVLGDNRNNSSDSHSWGSVPYNNIIGKTWISYWPTERLGLGPNYSFASGGG